MNEGPEGPDQMPWEIVTPSEWLCRPNFNDGGSPWIDDVQAIIAEGRKTRGLVSKPVSGTEMDRLQHILASYIKARVHWDGFLNKGDRDKLVDLKGKAAALLSAFQAHEAESTTKVRSVRWFIDQALADNPAGWTSAEIQALLTYLSGVKIRSPRFSDQSKGGRPSPFERRARAQLQHDIDGWWAKVVDLPLAKDPEKAPAFSAFLTVIFGRIILSNSPGYSPSAIDNARKAAIAHKREADSHKREADADFAQLKSKLDRLVQNRE